MAAAHGNVAGMLGGNGMPDAEGLRGLLHIEEVILYSTSLKLEDMLTLPLPLWTAEAYVVGTTLAFFTILSSWFQPPVPATLLTSCRQMVVRCAHQGMSICSSYLLAV